jgi:hypothetical protein
MMQVYPTGMGLHNPAPALIVKLELEISKKIFPSHCSTFYNDWLLAEADGTVIISEPSLGVEAAITVGNVFPTIGR